MCFTLNKEKNMLGLKKFKKIKKIKDFFLKSCKEEKIETINNLDYDFEFIKYLGLYNLLKRLNTGKIGRREKAMLSMIRYIEGMEEYETGLIPKLDEYIMIEKKLEELDGKLVEED